MVQWRNNGAMAAKQASTKRMYLMFGNNSDEAQLVLKAFYNRRDKQRLESNVFRMTVQADRSGRLRVCGYSKAKSGPKPKQLAK